MRENIKIAVEGIRKLRENIKIVVEGIKKIEEGNVIKNGSLRSLTILIDFFLVLGR